MKTRSLLIAAAFALLGIITLASALYTVSETEVVMMSVLLVKIVL